MIQLLKNLLHFVVLVGVVHAQNVISPQIQVQIDTLIELWMAEQNAPGLGLAITRGDGELVYSRGYGLRDVENRLIADSNTLFGIGSVTKSMTATIVIKILNAMFPQLGEAVLDTPIRVLAPGYNLTFGDRYRSESVTFRDLLSHKVCTLPEITGLAVMAYTNSDDILYRQRYAPEYCSFRKEYIYNNGLIAMAGDIIAHMTNSNYNDMLSEFLLGIGMNSTTWMKPTDDHNNMFGRAVPYIYVDGELIRYNPELLKGVIVINAAGGVLSNANDVMKYMQFHLNKGRVGGVQLVPEAAMAWLTTPSIPNVFGVLKTGENLNTTVDLNMAYGLCLNVGVYDGWLRVGHGGYLPPYESQMNLYPDLNLGIFTTMNGPGTTGYTSTPNTAIHNAIFDILQGNAKTLKLASSSSLNQSTPNPAHLNVGPFPIRRINDKMTKSASEIKLEPEEAVGTFGSGFNGEINITMRSNPVGVQQLYMEYGVWGRGWLTQVSNSTFNIEWDSDYWMMLWTNTIGLVNSTLNFLDVDTLQYLDGGVQISTNFERGLRLDDLPEVPYAPGSCGAEM